MAICLDAMDRKRMLRASDVLAEQGFAAAAQAVRAIHANSDLALYSAAFQQLRRVPEPVLQAAELTPNAAGAIPSVANVRPQQGAPSLCRAQR